jgi:hypothetical protein
MCPVKSVTDVIGLDQPKIYEKAPRTRLRGGSSVAALIAKYLQ